MFYIKPYEFEVAAKNAVIESLKGTRNDISIEDLDLLWFSTQEGNKKCVIETLKVKGYIFEVLYSCEPGVMFVCMYEHKTDNCYRFNELNFDANKNKADKFTMEKDRDVHVKEKEDAVYEEIFLDQGN